MMRDPATDVEWVEAVTLARSYLLVDAARQFGLVTGGPTIDVDRCIDVCRRGAQLGYVPDDTFVDAAVREIVGRRPA